MVSMIQALKNFFKNYVNFTGKATRAEYWWMALWAFIFSIAWGILSFVMYALLQMVHGHALSDLGSFFDNNLGFVFSWGLISFIIVIALIIPGLSLTARRYRDTGIDELWVWIIFGMNLVSGYTSMNALVNFITFIFVVITFIMTVLPTNIFLNNRFIGKNNQS